MSVDVTPEPVGSTPPVNDAIIADTSLPDDKEKSAVTLEKNLDTDLRGVWEKHNPPRTEDGKFQAKTPPAAEGAADKSLPADQTAKTDIEQEKPETVKPAIDVPLSWSAEQKAKWASVPPDLQSYIAQRDKENHDAISRAGQQIKAFEPFSKHLEPLREIAATFGTTEDQVLQNFVSAQKMLLTEPRRAIEWLAKTHGVDLTGLANGQAQDASAEVSALQAALASRDERIARIESHLTAQQRQQVETDNAALTRQIADFAKDKPNFETVRPIMAGLLTSGASETLQDAYDKAIYADPTTRQSILADQQKANEVKRKEEESKRVKDAKRAAGVNVKSSTSAGENPRSMDDDLLEIARRHYGT